MHEKNKLEMQLLIRFYYRHGAQGQMDGASKATLENEFGTHVDDEVIKQILEKGNFQETEVRSPSSLSTIIAY